jgi:hypothetical protein
MGDSHVYWAANRALSREGPQLGLDESFWITWKGTRGGKLNEVKGNLQEELVSAYSLPDIVIFHLGCNDLIHHSSKALHYMVRDLLLFCSDFLPGTQVIWSYILPRAKYHGAVFPDGMKSKLKQVNRNARNLFHKAGGKAIGHPEIDPSNSVV